MSLYLGKIHYWLFNKIVWFEGLEEEIIDLAKNEGLDIESLSKDINNKYGEKLPKIPLEEMIDTSNIHGWLQEKIHSAEGRLATWTGKLLEKKNSKEKLEDLYIRQGIKAAKEVKEEGKSLNTAVDIFNSVNDYILDGMPCDRVNEVISQDEEKVIWKRRICVHKDIWESANGDVNYFYDLRNLWIKSFVTEVNNEFKYTKDENNGMEIGRV
ncbi:hypothetical protein J1C67_02490 [Clostridium gasigenes]|uniref:hypothetical protein n=1 Tax=Clostridium gasigenes TaxID=94869 RepID=UPI0014384524|nr:hypothetical protein [Clostridium gasigenes]NKF06204.1 hypothetical protein [Clostridium gasigenes]QSW20091.1 hypothetical protein J1C67_02490 [Clostridium gasigenes]